MDYSCRNSEVVKPYVLSPKGLNLFLSAWVAMAGINTNYESSTGCPNKHGNSVTNSISSF